MGMPPAVSILQKKQKKNKNRSIPHPGERKIYAENNEKKFYAH